ncbi:unnamed protein product, partial [Ectocarpus sp. 12 AP-2014]
MQMTHTKYNNNVTTISTYEKAGAVVCFGAVLYLLFYFYKLDTWYLQACGIATLAILIILPILILSSLKKIQNLDILNGTYKETLIIYTKLKSRLLGLQQIGIALSLLIMFLIIPITLKIFHNKDLFLIPLKPEKWIGFSVVFIGMVFFSRWGYKSYKKVTKSA